MKTERYLLFFTLSFMTGIALAWGKYSLWLLLAVVFLAAYCRFVHRSNVAIYNAIIILGCLAGILFGSWKLAVVQQPFDDSIQAVFRVESQRGRRYIARIISSDHPDMGSKKILLSSAKELFPGSMYRGDIRLEPFAVQRIPNGFCEKTFYYSNNVLYKGTAGRTLLADQTDHYGRMLQFRLQLLEKNEQLYTLPVSGFVRAILFGDRTLLDDQLTESFRSLGLAHLLAVSGLHAGIIAGIIYKICTPGGFHFKSAAAVSVLAFYAFLAGFSPSVNRAALMFALAVCGKIQLRYLDPYTIIAGSALIQMLVNPFVIFSIGFQLSYTTLLAIITVSRQFPFDNQVNQNIQKDQETQQHQETQEDKEYPETKKNQEKKERSDLWKKYLLSGLRTSVAATFGSAPLVIFYFNKLPLSGILINLLYIPVFSGITFAAMAGLPLSWFFPDVVAPLYRLLDGVCRLFLDLTVGLADKLQFLEFVIASPPVGVILLCYLLAALWVFGHPFRKKLTLVVLIAGLVLSPLGKSWEMVVLDVGQGDAIYINTRRERVILIDGGPWGREVESFLNSRGVNRPDLYILTHAHADHLNGLLWLIERKPPQMLMVPAGCQSEAQQELIELALQQGVRVMEVSAGQRFMIDGMECVVLSPPPGRTYANLNNQSVVLQVSYRGRTVLLTGDAEREVLDILRAAPEIDILKAPHHGSNSGSSPAFFAEHRIKTAVIPVGENNRYRHPGQEFMAKLDANGIEIYRTDHNGTVSFFIKRGGRLDIKKLIE